MRVRPSVGWRAAAVIVVVGACVVTLLAGGRAQATTATATQLQVYGAWHCGNDFCTWGSVRDMNDFDRANHWLIDRNPDPSVTGAPSVNLVVLSFVQPLKLLNRSSDATTVNGVPRGMTRDVVKYFTDRGVRVMLSIGGITYVDAWNQALGQNATQLGLNAAAVASELGVGIEIDYEENTDPDIVGLQAFIDAYRSVHPYDLTGIDPTARLTIDVAAGDRWLIALNRKATSDWLRIDTPVLDYANAMVPARQPRSASDAQASWQEHVDGKPQFAPPVPPLATAKLAGALYVALGGKVLPECNDYTRSLQKTTAAYLQSVASRVAGGTPGMLGFMFWAAERPSTRGVGTVPPYTCENGLGAGATALTVPIPMPALRQR